MPGGSRYELEWDGYRLASQLVVTVKAYYRDEHGDNPVRIETADDLDALIDALLAEPYENSVAALYVNGRATPLASQTMNCSLP